MSEKLLILHAEDDPNDVLLVGLGFRKAAIPAVLRIVNDGEQVIQYLAGEGPFADRTANPLPALLLLDLKLPRRSGFEVLSWVRSHDDLRRLPIVMLTSSAQAEDINRCYEMGANSYVVKPSVLEDLVTMAKKISAYWLEFNARPALGPAD
jgi:CheY-like chemotaxis protein